MKRIGRYITLLAVLLIAAVILVYFCATYNTRYKKVYFSSQASMKDIDSRCGEVLYEFGDDKFMMRFYEKDMLASSKKDAVLWVRDYENWVMDDDVNHIESVTVGGDIYVYGATQCKDVSRVKLLDTYLNEKEAECDVKRIESKNLTCFCIKVPRDKLFLLSYSVNFVDQNKNILDEFPISDSDEIYTLLETVLNDQENKMFIPNEEVETPSAVSLGKTLSEKFYLTRQENSRYCLSRYLDRVELMFMDDYVLVREKREIETYYSKTIRAENFDKSYKMQYSQELLKLKEYALSQN